MACFFSVVESMLQPKERTREPLLGSRIQEIKLGHFHTTQLVGTLSPQRKPSLKRSRYSLRYLQSADFTILLQKSMGGYKLGCLLPFRSPLPVRRAIRALDSSNIHRGGHLRRNYCAASLRRNYFTFDSNYF